MEKEIWYSDQPVLQADLARAQSTKEQAITTRLTDEFNYGIVPNSQLLSEATPFAMTVVTSPSFAVNIGTGVAYDVNGQRVLINNSSIAYSAANLTLATDNGIGGTTITPASTGSYLVPLTSSVVNYVYITYVDTIDPTVFTLAENTNQRLFTSGTEGYRIDVVTNIGPSVGNPAAYQPFANSIFLGVIDTTQTLTTTARTTFTLKPSNLLAAVPTSTQTLSALSLPYQSNQEVTFPYHVLGLGTGTVTPTNVHGLSINDITGTFTGITSGQLLQLFMESGFSSTTSQLSTTSALYAEVFSGAGSGPGPGFGYDDLKIYTFGATEALNVNGNVASLSTITQSYLFYFLSATGVPLDNGTYTVYINTSTMQLLLAANGSPTNTSYGVQGVSTSALNYYNVLPIATVTSNPNNFVLWQVTWVGSVSGPGNITSTTDLRLFGTVDGNTLQRDSLTDTVTIPRNVDITGTLTASPIVTSVISALGNSIQSQLVSNITTTSHATVTAATLSVQGVVLSNISLTANISASGANGLDTGSIASSTWYALHVITNATGSSVASLFSLSATSPTLPSGYTLFRRVGWARSNSSSLLQLTQKVGSDNFYLNPPTAASGYGTNISFAAELPPTCTVAQVSFNGSNGNPGSGFYNVAVRPSGIGTYQQVLAAGSNVSGEVSATATVLFNTSQALDITQTGGQSFSSLTAQVLSYRDIV